MLLDEAMYRPPHFREDDRANQHGLIREYPLGLIVTAGPGGLMANPIPFLIDTDRSANGTLRAHLARANPQCEELSQVSEALIIFQGPQEYISPSWYATKPQTHKVVPTWNYATVHAWGRPVVIEDQKWLRRQIDDLTHLRESARADPWSVTDAPPSFVAGQIKGILGVEIEIARIEGKWKVSQNRPLADRESVVSGLAEQGPRSAEMAALVAERGKV